MAPSTTTPVGEVERLRRELAQRERELVEERRLLQSVFDSSVAYAIVVLDLQGVVVSWNEGARRAYGYSAKEAVGQLRLAQLLAPEDAANGRLAALQHEALAAGTATGAFECPRKSGERFVADVSLSLRRGALDAPIGYLMIAKDITSQREMEQLLARKRELLQDQARRVEEASRHKTTFLANMSHELRTPLNAVIGFAELLHDGKLGALAAPQRDVLGDVLMSARHLLQLINDILDLAKVEAGKLELRPEAIDVAALVGEVRDALRPLWSHKRLHIDVHVDPAVARVVLDPSRLKQVLFNYFSNAIKFTPDGGDVLVAVVPEGPDEFRVEVRDTGIGIHAQDLGRLFAEFHQLEAGAAKRYQGTGLGLAVTRRIVEMQGGRVGVESQPGAGSTFHAVLPRSLLRTGHEADKVLVVDDDVRDRRQIERALAGAGYAVEFAAGGRDAVRRCDAREYAAVILDLLLSDLPGSDVLRAIRAGTRNAATPVLVLSVVADLAAPAQARRSLLKPFRDADLVAALQQCGVQPRRQAG